MLLVKLNCQVSVSDKSWGSLTSISNTRLTLDLLIIFYFTVSETDNALKRLGIAVKAIRMKCMFGVFGPKAIKRPFVVSFDQCFWPIMCISGHISDFRPQMTLFDPVDDPGWPWDAYHWIQKKISNRMVCISCAFDHISDFRPQNDLVWPRRWPRMTLRCIPLDSEKNFQSNGMHIMCIWPFFRFSTPKMTFWPL